MPYYQENLKKKSVLRRICDRIRSAMYTPVTDLNVTAWTTPEPVPFSKRRSGTKKSLTPGKKWGDLFDCAWMRFTGRIPASASGKKVVLLIDVNGEACVVDNKGNPIRGLTSVNSGYDLNLGAPGKRVVQFTRSAKGGEKVDLWVEAGCNDLFGKLPGNGTFREACVAICNEEVRALYYDYEVLLELMTLLPPDRARRQRLLFKLEEAALCLRDFTEEEARSARAILAPELNKKNGDPSLTISAIGSAHIDLGWLWPIRETFRKGARTFSTVLELMNRYPDFVFGASQPQLYQWMKDRYPQLYTRIKKRVAEGRWEPLGAMWVEADTNLPGGESLVRQILYGKRFFREEFGWEIQTAWLPDVFGFSAALPQLLTKSGVDYFMTTKLSWSQFNLHPHNTFFWEGLDGSRVLAHMPPEDTYNSSAASRAILKAEQAFRDKGISDRCLLVFGIGDGGGGPGAEHLERLQREKNLNGIAPVVQENSEKFFKRISSETSRYATWTGELYLERHQGTYTTQAKSKRYNRKLEYALRELEMWAVFAMQTAKRAYPARALEPIWKEMLLYQFHDILPGSSITRVYDESLERYRDLLRQTEDLTAKVTASILRKIDTSNTKKPFIVTNSLSWNREEWIQLGDRWRKVRVPAMGYTVVDLSLATEESSQLRVTRKLLENDLLRVQFTKEGTIQSIFDKERQREVILDGACANQLNVYDDLGDAWDIPIFYDKNRPACFALESSEAWTEGPRAIVKQTRAFGQSKLVQEIVLTSGSRRIDFVTEVDWRETHKMLRASFPVAVRSNEATCDIQFGQIKRPTYINTSWEMGKYEICAHKWVDLSQRDYGVALMNDCKYGYKVRQNVLDINLLRSPTDPDPKADRARHRFIYSLYPHAGDVFSGGVAQAGYELNIPLKGIPVKPSPGALSPKYSFIGVDAENIIVESVKRAEDNNDIILRLYEAYGACTNAHLQLNVAVKAVYLVDLMEEHPRRLKLKHGDISLPFSPYEIKTVRVSVC